jgi:hypothetical protein
MPLNLHDLAVAERRICDANFSGLMRERNHLEDLMVNVAPNAPQALLQQLAGRIADELSLRTRQPV